MSKQNLAKAVAGCDLDPAEIPSGTEDLFNEENYPQIFPNSDPDFYLPRYRLHNEVARCAKGVRDRVYAKWLVLNFTWSQLAHDLRARRKCRVFRTLCERQDACCIVPLSQAIDSVYIEALRYYRQYRAQGDSFQDVVTFFKRKGHHKGFAGHWNAVSRVRRDKFAHCLEKVYAAMASVEQ